MTKKQVGSTVWESRGDDFYIVSATPDGDVVEVQQYDSLGHRYEAINFFAETAPKLVKLIQKAAGIKVEKVEYEYAMQITFGDTPRRIENWTTKEIAEEKLKWHGDGNKSIGDPVWGTWTAKLVKRRKAGPVTPA